MDQKVFKGLDNYVSQRTTASKILNQKDLDLITQKMDLDLEWFRSVINNDFMAQGKRRRDIARSSAQGYFEQLEGELQLLPNSDNSIYYDDIKLCLSTLYQLISHLPANTWNNSKLAIESLENTLEMYFRQVVRNFRKKIIKLWNMYGIDILSDEQEVIEEEDLTQFISKSKFDSKSYTVEQQEFQLYVKRIASNEIRKSCEKLIRTYLPDPVVIDQYLHDFKEKHDKYEKLRVLITTKLPFVSSVEFYKDYPLEVARKKVDEIAQLKITCPQDETYWSRYAEFWNDINIRQLGVQFNRITNEKHSSIVKQEFDEYAEFRSTLSDWDWIYSKKEVTTRLSNLKKLLTTVFIQDPQLITKYQGKLDSYQAELTEKNAKR